MLKKNERGASMKILIVEDEPSLREIDSVFAQKRSAM